MRLDTRGLHGVPSLLWLNDLQADAPYQPWSSDLADAAKPGYRSLQFARLPLFTALFVLDPATASGAALGAYAELLCRRSAPLHVAILATRAHDDPAGGATAAATAAAAPSAATADAVPRRTHAAAGTRARQHVV